MLTNDKNLHAIIIEDNKIFRFVFGNLLKGYGPQNIAITEFENGVDLLTHLEQEDEGLDADFLFLDLNMPFLSGWELLDKLYPYLGKKLGQPKIFIISSSISRLDQDNLKNYPFVNGYISKPFTKKFLFDLLDKELSA